MGFLVGKNSGSFMQGLSQEELSALHEILTWGSQVGNNPILRWYGPDLRRFDESCRQMMAEFHNALPRGSLKARIRCTSKDKRGKAACLADTLGEEISGMVQIDFQGHPLRYNELSVYEEVIAEARQCTLNLQVQVEGAVGWRSVGSMDLEADEGRGWRAGQQEGAQKLRDLHVKANDPHYSEEVNKRPPVDGSSIGGECFTPALKGEGRMQHFRGTKCQGGLLLISSRYDAKLFPHIHPYGTGSLLHLRWQSGSRGGHSFAVRRALATSVCHAWVYPSLGPAPYRSIVARARLRCRVGSGGVICGFSGSWTCPSRRFFLEPFG